MSFTCLMPIFVHGRQLPCGKCGNCLQKRSLEWMFRLEQESKIWDTCSFATLTYDEENLPANGVDKHEIQCFLKRLRKEVDFKYYATSEYGPNSTHRPHYHILFYHNLDAGVFFDHVERCWSKGKITCDEVCHERIMYCANYHITKTYNPEKKNPSFVLMSKGLGKNFLTDDRLDFFQNTGRMYVTHYDGYRLPMPRYFKKKMIYDPEKVLEMRKIIEKQSLWDSKSPYAIMKVQERIDKIIDKKLKKRKNIR